MWEDGREPNGDESQMLCCRHSTSFWRDPPLPAHLDFCLSHSVVAVVVVVVVVVNKDLRYLTKLQEM